MRDVLVFDGDCGFCARCVSFVERRLPADPVVIAWQVADLAALRLTQSQAMRAVQWVGADGHAAGGAAAVARLLKSCDRARWRALGTLMLLPPMSWLAEGGYRAVAHYRYRLPGGALACASPRAEPTKAPPAGTSEI